MDESVMKESKKRQMPDQIYNEETKRWVKKDGAVGKSVVKKQKEKKEQEKKEKNTSKNKLSCCNANLTGCTKQSSSG